jgi:hypothetical protein
MFQSPAMDGTETLSHRVRFESGLEAGPPPLASVKDMLEDVVLGILGSPEKRSQYVSFTNGELQGK